MNDKADAETVMNGWMMKLGKKKINFRKSHRYKRNKLCVKRYIEDISNFTLEEGTSMQQSKEERVHDVFEKISDKYDVMNSVISFQRHKAWRKETMRIMDVKPGSKALDVCCGTADWTIALAGAVGEQGKVVGLDFSENMLSVGKQR